MNQLRSPALQFLGDLIWLMAETCTNVPMPRGTQCLFRALTRNGQSVWIELSFLGQTFQSLTIS